MEEQVQMNEKLRALLEKAKREKKIASKDLIDTLEAIDADEKQTELIYEALDEAGVEIDVSDVVELLSKPEEMLPSEEDDSHLGDFIQDDEAEEPADAASYAMLREQLAGVLKTLTPREERVLRLRYGLTDGRMHTLEEVGEEFNVTRERIRQIEAKALRKLRHPSRSKVLKDFLG